MSASGAKILAVIASVSPRELGAEDTVLLHRSDVGADEVQKILELRRRCAARDVERLRGHDREHGERGIEAAASLRLLAPGEKCGRRHIILSVAAIAARNESALRGALRLLDVAVCGHGHVADIAMSIALSRFASHQQEVR